MSELEWLKQDWMIISMDRQKFIDDVVNSYNKHRANKITETKVLDNGRVVQFSNDICSIQVFNQSIDSVIISHKYNSGGNMKQFIVENDLSGYFRDNVIKPRSGLYQAILTLIGILRNLQTLSRSFAVMMT